MRGGVLHRWLADFVASEAERIGATTREEVAFRLPDGRATAIDVLIESRQVSIPVEIETTPRTVASNLEKASRLFRELWILVPNTRVESAVSRVWNRSRHRPSITVLMTPDLLSQALRDRFPAFPAVNEGMET